MIGAYIVEQYLRCHWPHGAACGCFIVGCSALVFYGSTIFSKPMDFPCTADCYLWRILENFLGGCLPFHLPHTQAQTLIFTFRYYGDWDPIVVPDLVPIHSLSLRKAALCFQLWLRSAEAHTAICHCAIISSSSPLPECQNLPLTLPCWQLLLPLGDCWCQLSFCLLLSAFLFPHLSHLL